MDRDGGACTRAWRVLALVVAGALALGGCSIGDRQRHADRIHQARERMDDGPALAGEVTYEVRLHPRSRAAVADLLGAVPEELALDAEVVVDAATERAELRYGPGDLPAIEGDAAAPPAIEGDEAPPTTSADPAAPPTTAADAPAAPPPAEEPRPVAAIFEGSSVFIKRQNLRPTERRTWAQLRYDGLPDSEPRPPQDDLAGNASLVAVAATVNPVHLLDLATGALAGSTKHRGPATIDGETVTRYTANVSFSKAMNERDLDDDELETRENLFRLLGFREDVVPAQFWLASDGSLRRMRLEVPQRVTRRRSDRVVLTLGIHGPAPAGVADAPPEAETVKYQRYGRLLRAAVPAG